MVRHTDQFFDYQTSAYNSASFQASPATFNILRMGFALDCLPQDTEIINLFKYWRLKAVKCEFTLVTLPTTSDGRPSIYTAFDPDITNSIPVTPQQVREYQSCRNFHYETGNVVDSFTIYPRPNTLMGDAATAAACISPVYNWIATARGNKLIHPGLIVCLDNSTNATDTFVVKTDFTYYFDVSQSR